MAENKFDLQQSFIDAYEGSGEIRTFFAPGRVNLIGEHIDYNGGSVFPAALTYGIWLVARKRKDRRLRLRSLNFDTQADCDIETLRYDPKDDWANYPKGVVHEMRATGAELYGADLLYYGNIPNGSGLSSSAAIELVTAYAMKELNGLDMDRVTLVKLSQKAENTFVGVNCGIMDQFAVGMGKQNCGIFLDCRTLDFEYVPLELGDRKIVITHTNKRRGLADSKYNERRSECEQGLADVRSVKGELGDLCELHPDEWPDVEPHLSSDTIRRRVRHVVEENHRVREAKNVLQEGDIEAFGRLMIASHESLRDLYEVTGRELDALFDAAKSVPGCVGTRMTGAGFGGCTVSIVEAASVASFQKQVEEKYREKTGLTPSFYVCDIGAGVREWLGGVNA